LLTFYLLSDSARTVGAKKKSQSNWLFYLFGLTNLNNKMGVAAR